jgi:putative transposase
MTSPLALCYDTFYHIFNRGNNRENLFFEEPNYSFFMRLYLRYISPVAETWAYCLLRNHFHIFVRIKSQSEIADGFTEPPEDPRRLLHTPSQHFSNFFNAYTKVINFTYNRTGSLFQHPFKRVAVTNERHFCRLIAYIHQNPQHHGFVSDFREWPYSSYHSRRSTNDKDYTGELIPKFFKDTREYRKIHMRKTYIGTINPLLIDDFL